MVSPVGTSRGTPGSSVTSSTARRSIPASSRGSVGVGGQHGGGVDALNSDLHPRYHNVLTPTKRVITVAPMPPEKSAYALARYSRSPDSIRDSIEWVRTPRLAEVPGELLLPVRPRLHRRPGPRGDVLRGHLRAGGHGNRRGAAVGRAGEIVALSGFLALRLRHAAGIRRATTPRRLPARRRGAAGRLRRGEASWPSTAWPSACRGPTT